MSLLLQLYLKLVLHLGSDRGSSEEFLERVGAKNWQNMKPTCSRSSGVISHLYCEIDLLICKHSGIRCKASAQTRKSYWSQALNVTEQNSTRNQINLAAEIVANMKPEKRLFLFINISALHQPNYFYLPGATQDSLASHEAA